MGKLLRTTSRVEVEMFVVAPTLVRQLAPPLIRHVLLQLEAGQQQGVVDVAPGPDTYVPCLATVAAVAPDPDTYVPAAAEVHSVVYTKLMLSLFEYVPCII